MNPDTTIPCSDNTPDQNVILACITDAIAGFRHAEVIVQQKN